MTAAATTRTKGMSLGDRIMKVDHAGEHGAVCIYQMQKAFARWRAPLLVGELDHFLEHELGHRSLFEQELKRRGVARCRSYWLCGIGGFVLGCLTGLAGAKAIAATTVAIERVVLSHMQEQIDTLAMSDEPAAALLRQIILEEREHHDASAIHVSEKSFWTRLIDPVVSRSTELVIWLGMKL